jgi:hypothetical protein
MRSWPRSHTTRPHTNTLHRTWGIPALAHPCARCRTSGRLSCFPRESPAAGAPRPGRINVESIAFWKTATNPPSKNRPDSRRPASGARIRPRPDRTIFAANRAPAPIMSRRFLLLRPDRTVSPALDAEEVTRPDTPGPSRGSATCQRVSAAASLSRGKLVPCAHH